MNVRSNRFLAVLSATPLLAAGAVLGSAIASGPTASAGSVIQVTTTQQKIGGPGGCSLEEAILAADHDSSSFTAPGDDAVVINSACVAGSGADTIELPPNATFVMNHVIDDAYNYTGPTATPLITSDVVIEGHGSSITHAGAGGFRAFAIGVMPDTAAHARSVGSLDLRDVTIQGFSAKGGDGALGGGGGLGAGGAIYVDEGSLLVQASTFAGNSAAGGNGAANWFEVAGGGGGGLGGNGGSPQGTAFTGGGGGGGSRGNGGNGDYYELGGSGGGGGGTLTDGESGNLGATGGGLHGGVRCGGDGGVTDIGFGGADGDAGGCPGGGGGGGESFRPIVGAFATNGNGGNGAYGGGGGGAGYSIGSGGDGGFGGGGGGGTTSESSLDGFGPSGGDGGFGGGGGSGVGGYLTGGPGDGGTFGGHGDTDDGGGGAGLGGAIFGHDAAIGVSNSTFFGNYVVRGVAGGDGADNGADGGGAIFAVGGSLSVVNSTVSGGDSTGNGAGVVVYGPSDASTRLDLYNTIIADNSGRDECFLLGNVEATGWSNLVTPHATDSNVACPGVDVTSDPLLGPLQLNAPGRTPTMAPDPSSPAVDAGDVNVSPFDDQRHVARPQGAAVDIGAYEYDGPPIPTDFIAPTASPTQAPPANTAGWNNTNVTVNWNWADNPNGSGIDPGACTTSSATSTEGASVTVNASCADHAGNVGSASYTAHVDLTAPTVTCGAAPVYVLNGAHTVAVTASVSDALSGPLAPTVGAAPTAGDVATAGVHTMQLTGADNAENSTSVLCMYLVAYRFGGFLEPIPQSTYKRGSTIPVKFRLTNANGTPISDAAAQALLTPTCSVRISFDGVDAGCARYNASTDTFQFDLKSSKTAVEGPHAIGVTVSAGSVTLNSAATSVLIRR